MALDAALADIRTTPFSRTYQWTKGALQNLVGQRYRHVKSLGNVNYRSGGPVEIADYQRGKREVERLLSTYSGVILLCGCLDLASCHRLTVANALTSDLGVAVTHLAKPRPSQQLPLL